MARKKQRYFLIPAMIALVLFLGGVASNLIAADLTEPLAPYPWLKWLVFFGALIATVWVAVHEYKIGTRGDPSDIRAAANAYQDVRRRYLNQIVERYRYLPLRAIDFKTASAETGEQSRLGLVDVYVALDTTTRRQHSLRSKSQGPTAQDALLAAEDNPPLTALHALSDNAQMVLLGQPGGGKTTFANHLAYCLAAHQTAPQKNLLAQIQDWPESWSELLPIPISLRDMAAWLARTQHHQQGAGLFEAYLEYWLATLALDEFTGLLCDHLQDGSALLLLDGLDEAPDIDDILERIKAVITALPSAYPQTPILVTCRVLSYEDPRWKLDRVKWPSFELAPLDDDKIDAFIRAWYNQLAAMHVVDDATALSAKLGQAVRRPDLWSLASNPLLLTVMALVHTNKGELPDARVLLYDDVVDLLLWRWEAIKLDNPDGSETTWRQLLREAGLSDIDIKETLWQLAYDAHAQTRRQDDGERTATADIAETDLLNALRCLHPERSWDWADSLVQLMKLRAGLLLESRPGVYSFPHRTFQEFLAACHLSAQSDFTDRVLALAQEGVYWWEVIRLAVSRQIHTMGGERPLVLVDELCPTDVAPGNDAQAWRNVWLAGACLTEIGVPRAQRRELGRTVTPRVRQRLATLLTAGPLAPRERAEAGAVLATLGDPRDLDEMVPVPAGPFTMGSTQEHVDREIPTYQDWYQRVTNEKVEEQQVRKWLEDELPQHSVEVEGFRIARYPVTNAQYALFVGATAHEPPQHWRGRTPPAELLNQPVVYVSWNDAVAYCRWLSEQRGEEVRLPSEAEWEKAARGTDGRIFPWGDEFDPNRCNMSDSGIGSTSPVGLFANSASPYGALDMAGNVWEWTLSEFRAYPYADDGRNDPAGTSRRVVRGGGFNLNRDLVRCAFRDNNEPDGREFSIGFRVLSPGL